VQPGQSQANTGGVSFEITPSAAQVFIDGSYVGTVGEFTPTTQPIGLTPGRHRIEIRARGYRTMELDADIVAGQVIPYQGVLER
jgi:archaellum component FlaG (FlaF/FlaG flagellin family)